MGALRTKCTDPFNHKPLRMGQNPNRSTGAFVFSQSHEIFEKKNGDIRHEIA
jgi:hypothetical protein